MSINLPVGLQIQYERLKAKIAQLDYRLTLSSDRYSKIRQQFGGAKDWYAATKSEAESSGTIPLDQKQQLANRQFAEAGSTAARQEEVIKQQLKDWWRTRKDD
jgi:hypothetical protein